MSLRNVRMVGLLEHLVGLECLELFLAIMLPLFNVITPSVLFNIIFLLE